MENTNKDAKEKSSDNAAASTTELSAVSEGEEEGEEDILAACINIGMQTNRHRQNKQATNQKLSSPLPSALPKYIPKASPPRTGIPVKSSSSRLPMPESRIKNTDPTLDTIRTYCTEDTPAMLSHAGSNSDLSVLSVPSKSAENDEKPDFSDDSSNLSGDNDNILAECIQSGMPKARRQIVPPKIIHKPRPINEVKTVRNDLNLPQRLLKNVPYFEAKDEIESYAVEDSPCHFSLRSSLSDLTVDGNVAGLRRRDDRETHEKSNLPYNQAYTPYPVSYLPSGSKEHRSKHSTANSAVNKEPIYSEPTEEQPAGLSRTGSLSSLSVESYGSTENAEQALLEQCISSGMPKSNKNTKLLLDIPAKHTSIVKNASVHQTDRSYPSEKKVNVSSNSKNVYVTSVVMSTTQRTDKVLSPQTTQATDVESSTDIVADIETVLHKENNNTDNENIPENTKNGYDQTLMDIIDDAKFENIAANAISDSLITQNSFEANMFNHNKNEYDIINKCSDVLTDCSIEDNVSPDVSDSETTKSKKIKNRMLDPDAMIESLDRFTAELVSHSSHLNSHDCKIPMNQSGNDGDTWNEDTSPNDVSFPSISISAPLVASFKSEDSKISEDVVDGLNSSEEKEVSNQFSSLNTMTDSTVIAMEAAKIMNVVHSEIEMIHSLTSMNSLDLDQVNPPSMMESIVSLSSSVSGIMEQSCKNSPKNSPLPARKKSLPAGLMVRRALSNSSHAKSLENLNDNMSSVSSSCNLELIKPPSIMGDFLDMVDMESSMVSVASITSEVADPVHKVEFVTNGPVTKELHENLKNTQCWSFDIKQPLSSPTTTHISDIENINPPSLLNEITDLCSSTADIETDVFEDCVTHNTEQTLQPENTLTADEITEYSDANSVTPVQSDFGTSSAESTPKKTKAVNKRLTPKQRRQLAKERYKTYTVAAEMVIREEFNKPETITESPDSTIHSGEVSLPSSASSSDSPRLTPKERRQLDRERFQTRVLDKSPNAPEIIALEDPLKKFATFNKTSRISSIQMDLSKFDIESPNLSPDKKIDEPKITPNAAKLQTEIIADKLEPAKNLQETNLPKLDIRKANAFAESNRIPTSPLSSKTDIRKTVLSQSANTPSPPMSPQPNRTKTDIRKAMQQKRLENKDRFRTRTISSGTPSPEVSPAPDRKILTTEELHSMLEHETNIILNTLEQNTSGVDDYLDCETVSLVSNEDDSEHNSVSSVNYRTYHKSWGFSKNLPVVPSTIGNQNGIEPNQEKVEVEPSPEMSTEVTAENSPEPELVENSPENVTDSESESEHLPKPGGKPKIVKPGTEMVVEQPTEEAEEQGKAIRGKKKAYVSPYRSPNLARNKSVAPKNVTSNLVKNVTSALTSKTPVVSRTNTKPTNIKPPAQKGLKPPTGYNAKPANRSSLPTKMTSPQKQTQIKRQSLPLPVSSPPKMERQGTFVKEDTKPEDPKPEITTSKETKLAPTSKIARAIVGSKSKSASSLKPPQKIQSKTVSSTTTKKTETGRSMFYRRSPSADRDSTSKSKKVGMHGSTSSQSLQSQDSTKNKRTSIPSMTQRSNSNVSITSTESGKKKQVTSKIASLWKRVEESKKKQPEKKDNKVWITAPTSTVANCDSTVVTC